MESVAAKHIMMLMTIAYHNKFGDEPCRIKDLIERLNMSQQTVSRHLIELEKHKLVRRSIDNKNMVISLTKEGTDSLKKHYETLGMIFNDLSNEPLEFQGVVMPGLGEGAFYIKQPKYLAQFAEILGGEPYHGTLNVLLNNDHNQIDRFHNIVKGLKSKMVEGFTTNERSYGAVECFEARIASEEKPAIVEDCYILNIHRTSHKYGTLEIISHHYLRDALGLKDNSKVIITLIK